MNKGHIQKNERVLLSRFKKELTYFEGEEGGEHKYFLFVRLLTSIEERNNNVLWALAKSIALENLHGTPTSLSNSILMSIK